MIHEPILRELCTISSLHIPVFLSFLQRFDMIDEVPQQLKILNCIDDAKNRRKNMSRAQERELRQNVFRFLAQLVSNRPEDTTRQFVITFFEIDETVSVFEKPVRNSGFLAGSFLERSVAYNHRENRVFNKDDFAIGKNVRWFRGWGAG